MSIQNEIFDQKDDIHRWTHVVDVGKPFTFERFSRSDTLRWIET